MNLYQIAAQLKPVILEALTRSDPHCGHGTGGGLIFTGNYDWHSSVHAHWALLSMARVTKDEPLRALMLARLSPQNLAAERAFLMDDTEFELPYGRAWFSLLLCELEKHRHGYAELPQLRALIENQVVSWLEQTPVNADCGSHQSWLFAFWLLQLGAPSTRIQTRLDALLGRIAAARSEISATRPTPYDFLFLPAVLFAIDAARGARNSPPTARLQMRAPNLQNCHTAGANVSRLWPFAFQGQYRRRLKPILARTEQWRDDFHLVSHWVPQFIWLGVMLEADQLA